MEDLCANIKDSYIIPKPSVAKSNASCWSGYSECCIWAYASYLSSPTKGLYKVLINSSKLLDCLVLGWQLFSLQRFAFSPLGFLDRAAMAGWRGRPPEIFGRLWLLFFILGFVGCFALLRTWGEIFGSYFGLKRQWALNKLWALREGVLPPSPIT